MVVGKLKEIVRLHRGRQEVIWQYNLLSLRRLRCHALPGTRLSAMLGLVTPDFLVRLSHRGKEGEPRHSANICVGTGRPRPPSPASRDGQFPPIHRAKPTTFAGNATGKPPTTVTATEWSRSPNARD
ncbi:hypothetical protein BIW11_10319 [Tropilaelaps mercedesae]|uniref:Uncharacterized protein n=1 Tax=Tropilaelaps mercedesae TaxID=418985 RepID=A0A1V9XG87_9ACAR|nr:hypothetical protein BIW11_10319 [Tropilaelaps mercedesae]